MAAARNKKNGKHQAPKGRLPLESRGRARVLTPAEPAPKSPAAAEEITDATLAAEGPVPVFDRER